MPSTSGDADLGCSVGCLFPDIAPQCLQQTLLARLSLQFVREHSVIRLLVAAGTPGRQWGVLCGWSD